jgi:hypothetical protein
LKKEVAAPSRKPRLTAVGIRCADHVTPSTRKSRHYFANSGGRSVGIVRLWTKAMEFVCLVTQLNKKKVLIALLKFVIN